MISAIIVFEPVKKKQIPHLHLQNDNMEEIEN